MCVSETVKREERFHRNSLIHFHQIGSLAISVLNYQLFIAKQVKWHINMDIFIVLPHEGLSHLFLTYFVLR